MNTFGRTEKTFGGGTPIWKRVDTVFDGGGLVDISSLAVGDIIPAGSMMAIDVQGGTATVVESSETDAFATVVGLLKNDIVKKEAGETHGTATIVTEGVVLADRIDVPAEVQAILKNILFVKEIA